MEALVHLAHRCSPKSIQEWFHYRKWPVPDSLPWDDFMALPAKLVELAATLSAKSRRLMKEDLERIDRMGQPDGINVLYRIYRDTQTLDALPDPYDRCLWVFQDDEKLFSYAEMLLGFLNRQGKVRSWGRYEAIPNINKTRIENSLQEFREALVNSIPGERHCVVTCCAHPGTDTVQINIFRQQPSLTEPSFDDKGTLQRLTRKPVSEFVIVYDSERGEFELTGHTAELRKKLSKLVGHHLLGTHTVKDISRQAYDLAPLIKDHNFTLSDGIQSVMMTAASCVLPESKLKIDLSNDGPGLPLHQRSQHAFSQQSPFQKTCILRSATLQIVIQSSNTPSTMQDVTLVLSRTGCRFVKCPNNQTKELIKNVYLPLWGLTIGDQNEHTP